MPGIHLQTQAGGVCNGAPDALELRAGCDVGVRVRARVDLHDRRADLACGIDLGAIRCNE